MKTTYITNNERKIVVIIVILLLVGYILLAIPKQTFLVSREVFITRDFVTDDRRIPVNIQKKGTYFVNVSKGNVVFIGEAKFRVYDTKENLVFSSPLFGFPAKFNVDSPGYLL
jgi:hypothetical protein